MKKIKKKLILTMIILFTMISPFHALALESNNGEELEWDSKIAKIESLVKKNMKKGKVPGVSVSIVKDKDTIYQNGFGYSNIDSGQDVTEKTLFEIGSNSKAFTGLSILKLKEDGLIKIEDSITDYIPWLELRYKNEVVEVTIEQFLHHTSGVPFRYIDEIPISEDDDALETTVKKLVGANLDSNPGEKFQYSTINYDVLGLVIEYVTGKSYEEYLKESVINPMGLKSTYVFENEADKNYMSKGYKISLLKSKVYDAPKYRGNKPAGYIISSGEDMAEWMKIQLGTSTKSNFNKEIIEESQVPNRRISPSGDGSSYAAGWNVYQKGRGMISHQGNNPNFSSFIVIDKEEKIGVAVLGNSNSSYVSYIGEEIIGILQGEESGKSLKDINKSADLIAVLIICLSIGVIISTIIFMVKWFIEVIKKERRFHKKKISDIVKIIGSLIFVLGITVCIYLVPNILYRGVSWKFIFVWLPGTVKSAVYLIITAIWGISIYSFITSFYRKSGDKSILLLILLSITSGFGNSLIIFTINMAINSSNDQKLKLLIYFILGIILYVYGQKIMRTRLIEVTNKMIYSKRMKIVTALLRTQYDQFEGIEKDRIQTTLNNDTEKISGFINILIDGITSTVTLVCCFTYLGFVNIYALGLSVVMIILIAGIYYFTGIYADKIGEESRDLQNKFFKFINDLIGGFKELSFNNKRKKEFEIDMDKSCDNYRKKRGKAQLAFANMFVIGELLFTLAIGSVVFLIPMIVKNLDYSSISSYVFILLYMTGPVHGILNTIPNAIEVRISWRRINTLLKEIEKSEYDEINKATSQVEKNIKLTLNKAEYEYSSCENRNFRIGPVDYEFKSGEIVFITGGNGSGKSTLAKLITGLYKSSEGSITLNDRKIKESSLSQKYSTIFSDFYLFDKLYGIDYDNKAQEIKKYLEILQLEKKVHIKNGQFSTTKLSTGQKKRLALLVTYLEDRPIYLFDEWAADQDPEFRKFFYKTLLPELKERGKCVIAVTHDDHYFDVADKVIKMELGKVVNCE